MRTYIITFIITVSYLHSTSLLPTSYGKLLNPSDPVVVGGNTTFDGSLSSDNDSQDHGSTPHWSWDFSYNGTFQQDISTTSAYTDWVYDAGGTYTVAVRYYDNDGEQGNTYTFTVVVNTMNRVYYLKDHLGSVRMTVQAGRLMVQDDFSSNLSQWTTTLGTGFYISSGELANSSSGTNILVNSSSRTLDDGIITVDVKNSYSPNADPSIVVRYQNTGNYYLVYPYNNYISIYEVISGVEYSRATGTIATIAPGQSYRLQITVEGGLISVCWNRQPIVSWTDSSPWLSGKVGFRERGSRNVKWDNITVWTNGPGKVAGYDDYDPWGQVLAGRSSNSGNPNDKDKFTGKERDIETGLDYFGARYYDSWRGQWLQIDPLVILHPDYTPFAYVYNNPMRFVDPFGLDSMIVNPASNRPSYVDIGNMNYSYGNPNTDDGGSGNSNADSKASATYKFTEHLSTPTNFLDIYNYSSVTIGRKSSTQNNVFNGLTHELESVEFITPAGIIIYGMDGSGAVGNGWLSLGQNLEGQILIDVSAPSGFNSRLGLALEFDPFMYKLMMEYSARDIGNLIRPFWGNKAPAPFPIPSPLWGY